MGRVGFYLGCAAVGAALFPAPARSQAPVALGCTQDEIDAVSRTGRTLRTLDGSIFKIDDADAPMAAIWLATEQLLVCEFAALVRGRPITIYEILNVDQDDEPVYATRVR